MGTINPDGFSRLDPADFPGGSLRRIRGLVTNLAGVSVGGVASHLKLYPITFTGVTPSRGTGLGTATLSSTGSGVAAAKTGSAFAVPSAGLYEVAATLFASNFNANLASGVWIKADLQWAPNPLAT